MRLIKCVLLLVIPITIAFKTHAQTTTPQCSGSFGDPVIDQDFGSGSNPGPALPASVTNMIYTSSGCPNDNYYTIANSVGNCFEDTWHILTSDHTGNPNGYMMVINASVQPSIFFTQAANGLCPNTTYQFAAWILNLDLPSDCGGTPILPNVTFSISTTDGTVLQTYNTGNIAATTAAVWQQYGTTFTTPANVTDVIVTMTNNATGGCGNDIVLDDITFRACGPVINAGFDSISGAASQQICQGDNAAYTIKASVQGNSNPGYQWQTYNNSTSSWTDMPNENADSLNITFTNAVAGTYQYRLGVTSSPGVTSLSCRTYTPAFTVNVYANPVITGINPVETLCQGDSLVLSASGGVTYQWTGPNLSTTQNPVVIPNASPANSGKYKVVAYNQYSCSSADSTIVTVNPLPTATASGETTICTGDSTRITATGGTSYSWSPGASLSDSTAANPVAHPSDTTIYTVKVFNQYGCFVTDTVTVNVLKKAIAKAGPDKVIFEGQSVTLNGSEKYGNLYYWTPTTGLSDPNSLTPTASPANNTTYTLHVTSTANCGIDSSSVFVRVYKKITIPNTFSPNNDGINDYWDIQALITYPDCLLLVFNRNGQQVYKSIGYSTPWDGRYNGEPLPSGTYYYVLDLKNNTPKMAGWVLIIR